MIILRLRVYPKPIKNWPGFEGIQGFLGKQHVVVIQILILWGYCWQLLSEKAQHWLKAPYERDIPSAFLTILPIFPSLEHSVPKFLSSSTLLSSTPINRLHRVQYRGDGVSVRLCSHFPVLCALLYYYWLSICVFTMSLCASVSACLCVYCCDTQRLSLSSSAFISLHAFLSINCHPINSRHHFSPSVVSPFDYFYNKF